MFWIEIANAQFGGLGSPQEGGQALLTIKIPNAVKYPRRSSSICGSRRRRRMTRMLNAK